MQSSPAPNVGQLIDDNHAPAHQPVKVDYQFVNDRLGLQLTPDEMAQLLRNVEMRVRVEGDQLTNARTVLADRFSAA